MSTNRPTVQVSTALESTRTFGFTVVGEKDPAKRNWNIINAMRGEHLAKNAALTEIPRTWLLCLGQLAQETAPVFSNALVPLDMTVKEHNKLAPHLAKALTGDVGAIAKLQEFFAPTPKEPIVGRVVDGVSDGTGWLKTKAELKILGRTEARKIRKGVRTNLALAAYERRHENGTTTAVDALAQVSQQLEDES